MVQEPSVIIECTSERSLFSSCFMYRMSWVSERCVLKHLKMKYLGDSHKSMTLNYIALQPLISNLGKRDTVTCVASCRGAQRDFAVRKSGLPSAPLPRANAAGMAPVSGTAPQQIPVPKLESPLVNVGKLSPEMKQARTSGPVRYQVKLLLNMWY